MQAPAQDRSAKRRKLAVNLLVGGVVGFAGASAMTAALETGVLGTLVPSQVIALLVALVYLLMGLAVSIGLVSPRVGAKFLNVEDAQELEEERKTILPSALSAIALAAGLAALALAGTVDLLAPATALAVFGVTLAAATWLSVIIMRQSDELMRAVMRDSAAASFYLAFAVIGGWAMLAHLGLTVAPAMLDIVSLFYALTLVGCFWVIGRRGMLVR